MLGSHVADGAFAGAANGFAAFAKKLYELTGWERVIKSLYTFGEVQYVLDALESRIESLSLEMRIQLLRYYLWNQLSQKAFFLESLISSTQTSTLCWTKPKTPRRWSNL